jgi:predicted AlkP superfamily pyrophosphatase or phosphodiesterase
MNTFATWRGLVLLLLVLLGGCHKPIPDCGTMPGALPAPLAPRLVVQITVDQLRHDLLERGAALATGDDGFRKLLREGVVFANARFTHSITETSVGHATLFTGALPRQHGIVGNEWFDVAARANVYAVDDASTTLVGGAGAGRSPRNLLVPTLGDVLRERSGNQALVFAVSEKDRGAVLPAGHAGRAYWLDDASGRFVTSSYYGAQPAWFDNGGGVSVESLRGKRWELSLPAEDYTAPDDVAWERSYKHLGRVFPHPLDAPLLKDFTRGIKYTPFSDELVLAFVRELLSREPLGKDDVADLLAVSFSATDYVGHAFGPESREAEDNLVRLDRTLAALMALAEQVAPGRVLFVLSADHGIAESPEWWLAQGIESGRLEPDKLIAALNASLRTQLNVSADLVSTFVNPALYLDELKIRELGLELAQVEAAVVELVASQPGFGRAFSRSAALAGQLDGDEFGKRVAASMHPERSGHVYLVPRKHWLLVSDPHELAAMHGTPWPYDSHVPIVFWGAGVKAQRSWRRVDPRDIAPTLARVLGVPAPAGSSGTDMSEVQLR